MEKNSLVCLDLCSPLFYKKIDKLPSKHKKNEEFLVLYELDPVQCCSIEPVWETFPGKLIFAAQKLDDLRLKTDTETIILPAGKYLFIQKRNKSTVLEQEELHNLAIEQQKDGLWERYKLTNQLYIRFLFEDNLFVTQFFRPCTVC
jgi:hypothetical protein